MASSPSRSAHELHMHHDRRYRARRMSRAFLQTAERLDPQPMPYQEAPCRWVKDCLREFAWSRQRQILTSIRNHRYTAVPSCHDSGKSYIASRAVAWWIDQHPPGTAFAVTTAPTGPQVEAILWREIGRAHVKGQLVGRITLDCKWRLGTRHNSELVAYGRKPNDYEPDAFQGIHQKYVLVVIDEANGVPKALFDAVDTLVTNENCRVLAIGNPDNPGSHFASICAPGSGWNVLSISAFDTPNFTDEWVPEGIRDLLLSPTWVDEREKRWGKRSPLYISKVLGKFPDTSEDLLIQPQWLWDAIERPLKATGRSAGQFGCDIARRGVDATVIVRQRDGYVTLEHESFAADTMQHAGNILRIWRDAGSKARVVIDGVGVGGGVVDRVREEGLPAVDYNGGSAAANKRKFKNARSQDYWRLRELFREGKISLPPQDTPGMDMVLSQLGSLMWETNSKGQIEVESKDDYMERMRTTSPDYADAVCMAFARKGVSNEVDFSVHRATPQYINGQPKIPSVKDILGMQLT